MHLPKKTTKQARSALISEWFHIKPMGRRAIRATARRSLGLCWRLRHRSRTDREPAHRASLWTSSIPPGQYPFYPRKRTSRSLAAMSAFDSKEDTTFAGTRGAAIGQLDVAMRSVCNDLRRHGATVTTLGFGRGANQCKLRTAKNRVTNLRLVSGVCPPSGHKGSAAR